MTATLDRIARLARQGLTGPQIAERLGCTRQNVYRICAEHGTTLGQLRENGKTDQSKDL